MPMTNMSLKSAKLVREISMIDFTFTPEVEQVRLKVREFMDTRVRPDWEATEWLKKKRGELSGEIASKLEHGLRACKEG